MGTVKVVFPEQNYSKKIISSLPFLGIKKSLCTGSNILGIIPVKGSQKPVQKDFLHRFTFVL
jgi:hypothetical protein